MTPPTVELGGKEANPDVKVLFPTVKQPKKTTNNKKYKYFTGVVIVSGVIIAAVVFGSIALYHHLSVKQTEYETETVYKGYHIPEHAYVDYIHKITYVNNSRYNEVVPANNLHDYKKQLLVFKNVENQVCYIDKLNGTFEEGVSRLSEKKVTKPTPVKHVIITGDPIDKRVLRKFAGDAIADHCSGIPTYWVIDDEPLSEGKIAKIPSIECNNAESSALCRQKKAASAVMSCHTTVIIIRF